MHQPDAGSDRDEQLTVFAPTDAASGKLGLSAGNVCSALDEETLTAVLLFHVVEGRRNSTSVLAAPRYQTLSGMRLTRSQLAKPASRLPTSPPRTA